MDVELLGNARTHARRDAVGGEDVAVDRRKFTQDDSGELSDRTRKERLGDAELGIPRARF